MTVPKRLLIYSHDSFGLGHLRRCRAIAHHLVTRYRDLSVLILSGSPIIGSFDFKSRVDFVRVPGVIKLRDGEYTPLQLHIDIEHTLAIRASIIRHTAEIFAPHLCLIDKEPLGLRGEVRDTLTMLKERGTRLVLGLRDVMDEPTSLNAEWQRKQVFPALRDLYDEIWVYGLREIFDPLNELPGLESINRKVRFTGYLRRDEAQPSEGGEDYEIPEDPFLLVTPGGGGDGETLIDWVLAAYEADPTLKRRALVVFGPFMSAERRADFQERVQRLERVEAITFAARIEPLLVRAAGVVAMGGYNTFCEILSFDKPALVVPRTEPRLEQALRARRAEQLGLLRVLMADGPRDPAVMAAHLHALPDAPRPSQAMVAPMLDGLERVAELADPWLGESRSSSLRRAAG